MNVVYDIALLGKAFVNPQLRTGIHRYAWCLLEALTEVSEINLRPAASHDYESAKQFMADTFFCQGLDFPKPSFSHLRESLLPFLGQDPPSLPGVSKKLSAWELRRLRKAVQTIREFVPKLAPPIAPQSLKDADIYHSPFFGLPAEIPSRPGFARVLTIFDLIPIRFPYYFSGGEEHTLRRAIHGLNSDDHVICISECTRNDFLGFTKKLKPEQVHVTPLGASSSFKACADPETIRATCKAYGIDPGRPYVLSLCTLEPRKNLSALLRAVSQLRNSGELKDVQVVLAGGKGWMLDSLLETVEGSGLIKDCLIITGRIDDADLAAVYSGATVFAYPSLYEGFGLPPLEAMNCGTPVITSNVSSLPEVVGDAAIMVDPRSVDELAQALLTIFSDDALRENLRARGLERARRFSWSKCADDTVNIYQIIHGK